ncbi:PREDICTED: uncharacterized protein LOC109126573 [Camelina sativa]|uniref:Uncharacterized protein LOC109126573 n=1 Tax=Camelina sativa TaxID=90675 RepID=A0ABM1QGB3_CAMSA|nr:PREDICTED: uncharacterized protein LOC109126573 [Camelina sativa]
MEMTKKSMMMIVIVMVMASITIREGEAVRLRWTCKQMCIDQCGGRITVPESPCLRKCLHEKCGSPPHLPVKTVGMRNIRG